MNKTTRYLRTCLLSMLFFCFFFSMHSQDRSCGMTEYMEEQMKNPVFAKQYRKSQASFKAQLAKNIENKSSSTMMNPIVIPVAVHFPSGLESDRACLEALAQNQIDILNQDYTATNTDIAEWNNTADPLYPNVSAGVSNILFCIATMNHPAGTDPDLVDGGPAVTIGYNFGNGQETDSNWGGYMNFLIKDIGGGLLGFSPLGGSIAAGNSVTMNLGAFGSGPGCPNSNIVPGAPYNLGRTVTHELGHFYNLDHTWGGGCGADDGIADTPDISGPTYGCPTVGGVTMCGNTSLTMNYMDYTNDACMYMFSAGQTSVVDAYIMSLQSQFKPNVATCSAAPDFTMVAANSSESICTPTNSATYTLTYTTIGGNTDPTTFSASNLPSGTSATFNPTSLNGDGTYTMTVNNTNALAANTYSIMITGMGITTNSIDVDLIIEGAIPTSPTLDAPANGASDTPVIQNLSWSPIAGAATYTIETSTNSTFTANVTSDVANSAFFTTPELNSMTQYFWRVKSTNSCGESAYSSVYNFTTAAITCSNYNSTQNNINIPGSGNTDHVAISTINVGSSTTITDLNVTINIQHDWAGDMELKLTSPNGTEVIMLVNSLCDDGTNDINVTYDDQAAGPVVCSTIAPAVGGIVQPANPLSAFNGEDTMGDWTLTATDGYPSLDGGTFQDFSIQICGIASLSVDEFSAPGALSLWPNPSLGDINLSFNTFSNEDVNVRLYDLRGRQISNQSFDNTGGVFNKVIQLGDLDTAVYILSIENGGQIINKRIVIE